MEITNVLRIRRSCRTVFILSIMVGLLSSCAHRNDELIELFYSFYPANPEAGSSGFMRGTGVANRSGESSFELLLPSGETLEGESTIVDSSLLSFDGVYAQAMKIDEPTSLSPSVYQFLSQRLQPFDDALTVFTSAAGNKGSQFQCEGFWQLNEMKGLGGCSLSDGSLFKYHVKGNRVKARR